MGKWGMHSGVKTYEKHDGGNEKILGSSGDPLLTPQRPKILLLDMGMWDMYSGVNAYEKRDDANEKRDLLLSSYIPLIGLKFQF